MKIIRKKVTEMNKKIKRGRMLDEITENATKWDEAIKGKGEFYDFLREENKNIKPISREEFEEIVENEGLDDYLRIEFNPDNLNQADMFAFIERNNTYYEYITGERAGGHAYEFKDEEIALGKMLDDIRWKHEYIRKCRSTRDE